VAQHNTHQATRANQQPSRQQTLTQKLQCICTRNICAVTCSSVRYNLYTWSCHNSQLCKMLSFVLVQSGTSDNLCAKLPKMVSKEEALIAGHKFRCMPFTSIFPFEYCFPCSQMTTKHHGMTMSNQMLHNTLDQHNSVAVMFYIWWLRICYSSIFTNATLWP